MSQLNVDVMQIRIKNTGFKKWIFKNSVGFDNFFVLNLKNKNFRSWAENLFRFDIETKKVISVCFN
jgi:hypothetical protein